jgi:endoglucanase
MMRWKIAWTAALTVAAGAGAVVVLGTSRSASGAETPVTPAERFLSRYVTADGRVVRREQGGDTVSEGQAYAMLLTAASGDRDRFRRVWRWTRAHLQRRDGLLSSVAQGRRRRPAAGRRR